MKKYFLGLFAIILASGFSAFKASEKLATKDFQFNGIYTCPGEVMNPHNWVELTSSISCCEVNHAACRINDVPSSYYHYDQSLGLDVLNDYFDDQINHMIIAEQLYLPNYTYYVISVNQGTRVNQQ